MINIENNQNIFNLQGLENNSAATKNPFNNYTYNQVDFNISVSIGVVIIYPSEDIQNRTVINLMRSKFRELNKDTRINLPYSSNQYNSTYHTLVTTKPNTSITGTSFNKFGKSYRKLITNSYDIKKSCEDGSRFVWYIQVIDSNPYLKIVELSSMVPQKSYLMRAVSTIIYDGKHLFNVKNGTKQINYPALTQYNMYKNNKILDTTIHISHLFGLDHEIISYYSDGEIDFETRVFGMYASDFKCDMLKYDEVEIRRVNKDKKWHIQIKEPFDYEKQEELESNTEETGKPPFPNDVCFITGMPIYSACYILKVGKLIPPVDATPVTETPEPQYENISHIMVSSYIYHLYFTSSRASQHNTFTSNFLRKSGYTIIQTFISTFPRTELEAIELIPPNKISPMKRDILTCISKNGGNLTSDNNNHTTMLFTINMDKKIVYVGVETLSDIDIMTYQTTNTVLFHFKLHH
jgi:hypothetical protein